eukprot:scaffold177523_cov17-Tisochrysis_lutea.AAC.1
MKWESVCAGQGGGVGQRYPGTWCHRSTDCLKHARHQHGCVVLRASIPAILGALPRSSGIAGSAPSWQGVKFSGRSKLYFGEARSSRSPNQEQQTKPETLGGSGA